MLYKDACNSKSNQQNLGTIKCSNLCTEIVEYSSPDEVSCDFTQKLSRKYFFFKNSQKIILYLITDCSLQFGFNSIEHVRETRQNLRF